MDISAAAAVSWSRGTTRGIDASSDGRWSAAIAIISAVITYNSQTAGCRARAFSMRSAAQQARPASHATISRRRSNRSASTPPYRPTAKVDPVRCRAWTSSATSVASVPSAVTVRLAYSSRKSREVRSGVRSARSRRLPPDVLGNLDDQFELGHFLLVAEHVALDRGGEAALRRQAQLVQRHELRRLVDPALDRVRVFQLAPLGGYQAEHDHLAGRHEAQRLEAAGALVVVFEEKAVHGQL